MHLISPILIFNAKLVYAFAGGDWEGTMCELVKAVVKFELLSVISRQEVRRILAQIRSGGFRGVITVPADPATQGGWGAQREERKNK